MIDLDVILGEFEPKSLKYRGTTYELPAELPGDVIAPFLDDDLGLVELVSEALADADDTAQVTDVLFGILKKRPRLPLALVEAARVAFERLLGTEQYESFMSHRPSINAYLAIGRGITDEYGVSLADFFGSDESSEGDGEPSKGTSNSTTTSTPEVSGDAQVPKAS